MRIFKSRPFHVWSTKVQLLDQELVAAVQEINSGLIDATIGGGLYKKRIKIGSRGKRSGARVVFVYKQDEKIFFMHGFTKKTKDNINVDEFTALKELGKWYLNLDSVDLMYSIKKFELIEVKNVF